MREGIRGAERERGSGGQSKIGDQGGRAREGIRGAERERGSGGQSEIGDQGGRGS